MRITFFAHGTRGDVWPVVALAWHMAELDHDVIVAVSDEFREFTESAGVRVAPLPLNVMEWLATAEGQKLLHVGGLSLMRGWQREFSRHANAFDDAFESIAQGAEALVSNQVMMDRAQAMGDKLNIPVATVYPMPLAPSAEYASMPLSTGKLRSRTLRRASHAVAHRVFFKGSAAATTTFRHRLGLPADSQTPFDRQQHAGALALHTVSPSLFPRPTDWPAQLKITGAWQMPKALRDSQGEGVPAELSDWLDAGDPPVYLGFGSMPVLDPQPLLDAVVAATATLGQRALLNADWGSSAAATLPDRIRLVGIVDHDRLFPRCAAVVHHGGAGSTTASLRAGRPTMVCSVFSDQPWWGGQLERLGVGSHVPFRKLNHDNLLSGLRTLADPAVQARAEALGDAITAEGDGLPEAARLLNDWLVTAEPTPDGTRRHMPRRLHRTPSRRGILVGLTVTVGALGAAAMMSGATAPTARADDFNDVISAVDVDYAFGQSAFTTASTDFSSAEFAPGLAALFEGINDDSLSAPDNLLEGTVAVLTSEPVDGSFTWTFGLPTSFADGANDAQQAIATAQGFFSDAANFFSGGDYGEATLYDLFGAEYLSILPVEDLLMGAAVSF